MCAKNASKTRSISRATQICILHEFCKQFLPPFAAIDLICKAHVRDVLWRLGSVQRDESMLHAALVHCERQLCWMSARPF